MYVHIIELLDLKLRPIVAGPNCSTRSLNKTILLLFKSSVKDNLDFLSKSSRENCGLPS